MAKLHFIALAGILLIGLGCDVDDRLAKLEKENVELKAAKERDHATTDYDLQAKCSRDAKSWFNENSSRDKDTLLLTFINHYNKKENKCFIFTELHYTSNLAGPNGTSWTNLTMAWDIYENLKFGDLAVNHYTYFKPEISTRDEVITCEVSSKNCKTEDEFNTLLRSAFNE